MSDNINTKDNSDGELMSYEDSQAQKTKKLCESKSINVKDLQKETESVAQKIEIQRKRKEKRHCDSRKRNKIKTIWIILKRLSKTKKLKLPS